MMVTIEDSFGEHVTVSIEINGPREPAKKVHEDILETFADGRDLAGPIAEVYDVEELSVRELDGLLAQRTSDGPDIGVLRSELLDEHGDELPSWKAVAETIERLDESGMFCYAGRRKQLLNILFGSNRPEEYE